MTERKLLELAAKAVGYEFVSYNVPTQDQYPMLSTISDELWAEVKKPDVPLGSCLWNPLTDDGDALRLVASLELGIRYIEDVDGKLAVVDFLGGSISESADVSKHVATRRAIVRAAAETGKTL